MPLVMHNSQEEMDKLRAKNPDLKESLDLIDDEFKLIELAITLRRQLGITQDEVSRKSGLSQQAVSRLEKAGASPTLRNFIKYLNAAGLELTIVKKNQLMSELIATEEMVAATIER